jgi:asparagine synthase (glutamine-hydrolysing)
MSVQFGEWNFEHRPIDPCDLERVRSVLALYGPDREGLIRKDDVAILYRAFNTTSEARNEQQPLASASRAIITWDGRLDNREQLAELVGGFPQRATDVEIVAAAYDRWQTGLFPKLMGDWAISVWDPNGRSLILAKDVVGTRHLYYSRDKNRVRWCTVLDPLVLLTRHSFEPDLEYLAGFLSFFPATHLTPYVGIHSVPPATFVRISPGTSVVKRYWDFDPGKRTRYRTDAEYEEHFRTIFSECVRRRLRSDQPVLAELSGGIDSSSIVCVADQVISHGLSQPPRLETMSFSDDSEPNWNERPYFECVERKRGRDGFHIEVHHQPILKYRRDGSAFAPTTIALPPDASEQVSGFLRTQCIRVILSGFGGDEIMGGVPTPIPELQDLIVGGHWIDLYQRLIAWALSKRVPWPQVLFEAVRGFCPPALVGTPKHRKAPSWLASHFAAKHARALSGYEKRVTVTGIRPSMQENLSTVEAVRRRLSCTNISYDALVEKRYPYLDRDLLEFVFSIPREQLLRPGQRRSLVRRALRGIVPHEVLDRKRKGFVVRCLSAALNGQSTHLDEFTTNMRLARLGIVNSFEFAASLRAARSGRGIVGVRMLRALNLEMWLRNLETPGLHADGIEAVAPSAVHEISAEHA